jgi:hypothetical protein
LTSRPRARWGSPIWYAPSAEARKAGTAAAALQEQGAVALDDTQLKALIVEKSVWLATPR